MGKKKRGRPPKKRDPNVKPKGWTKDPKVREAYELAGRNVGEALMHDQSKEPEIWEMIRPFKLWPRWYLMAFRSFYIAENPRQYQNSRVLKFYHLKKAAEDGMMKGPTRSKALRRLKTKPQPRKDAGPEKTKAQPRKDAGPETTNPNDKSSDFAALKALLREVPEETNPTENDSTDLLREDP